MASSSPVEADVGQVGRIGRVPVVGLGDALTRPGGDLAVQRRPVGRGGEHQGDEAAHGGVDDGREMPGVAADHLAVPGRPLGAGVGDVGPGQLGPLRLVLDADGVTAEVDGLDEGRADAGHRVEDQVAGLGVGGDGPGGDGGEHLGRVVPGDLDVAAGALGAGVALGGGPHREGKVSGHGRPPRGS